MYIAVLIRSAAAVGDTWTTPALVSAMRRFDHRVWVVEEHDLSVDGGRIEARAHRIGGVPEPKDVAIGLRNRTFPRVRIALEDIELLLLRTTPVRATVACFAACLEDRGVRVVNRPEGLLRASSKVWLASLGVGTPPTLVTRSRAAAHGFHQAHGDIVVKPDRGSGGRGVFAVRAGDEAALDDVVTEVLGERRMAVLQPRLDGAAGEKRLVWCCGELLGGYLRERAPGEFRHNLKQGATPRPLDLTDADHALCRDLTPHLMKAGIRLAGLDVLDGHLLEVNALNPGGTVHADALHGSRLAERVVELLTLESLTHGLAPPPQQEADPGADRPR